MTVGYSPVGATVSDESIAILLSTTIGGSPGYYYGAVDQLANLEMVGTVSSTVGVYTGASLSGTRYEILFEGAPSAGQLVWDTERGYLYSVSTHGALYATYRGFGEFEATAETFPLHYPNLMESGDTEDWVVARVNRAMTFSHAAINVAGNLGAAATFSFYTSTGGGGSSVYITIAASTAISAVKPLSSTLAIASGGLVALRSVGRGCSAVTAFLFEQAVR